MAWAIWPSTPIAPVEQSAPGLVDSATVTWVSQNVTSAKIRSETDLEWTLGYIHGLRRTWSLLLWRQTATGHLSSWFGTGVTPLDQHVHQLGIPFQSRRAYAALPDSIRQRVRAYTRGVNAALSTPSAQEHDELLALEHVPDPWMPWHTLAVEHLFSWLSTPDLSLSDRAFPADRAFPGEEAEGRVVSFAQSDSLLRSFLHVRGLDRSVAWSRVNEDGLGDVSAQLATRLVTGSTAMPILHDVSFNITRPSSPAVVSGGTLPGSLVWLSGSHSRSTPTAGASATTWTILPGHAPSLHRLPADSLTVHRRYIRLTPEAGDEQSVEIRRVDLPRAERREPTSEPTRGIPLSLPSPDASQPADTLAIDSVRSGTAVLDVAVSDTAEADASVVDARAPVAQDSIPVDSIWVLSWNGLRGRSDAASWTELAHGKIQDDSDAPERTPSFSLHDGTGLLLDEGSGFDEKSISHDGASVRLLSTSPYVYRGNKLTVVGRSAWTGPVALSLNQQTDQHAAVNARSDTSQWAASILRDALPNLEALTASSGRLQEALTYLRNWDATYDRSSIGASVFEIWMDEYAGSERSSRSVHLMRMRLSPPSLALADSLRPDTTYFAAHRQRRAFRRAVHHLTKEHGPDLRQWRWERVAPNRRFFPVWSSDSLITQDLSKLATTRYAPITVPGRGHPSTPSGGPSLLSGVGDPYATVWRAWSEPGQQALVVRRSVFDVSGFLARPFLRRDEITQVVLSPDLLTAPDDGDPSRFPARTRLVPVERP